VSEDFNKQTISDQFLIFRVNDAVKMQKTLQKDLEVWVQKEKEAQEKLDEDAKRTEKWAAKENLLHQKIEECTEKIAGLGALPQVDPAYNKMSLKTVSVEFPQKTSK
jgi:structural maintenance of chromosome 3 (chondroitin sulfate proteoglycan 6)